MKLLSSIILGLALCSFTGCNMSDKPACDECCVECLETGVCDGCEGCDGCEHVAKEAECPCGCGEKLCEVED